MCGCFAWMSVYHLCAMPMEVRRGHQSVQELELQGLVSHHVGTGNRTLVFWKSSPFTAEPSLTPQTHILKVHLPAEFENKLQRTWAEPGRRTMKHLRYSTQGTAVAPPGKSPTCCLPSSYFFETGSHVAQAGLELAILLRMALNF